MIKRLKIPYTINQKIKNVYKSEEAVRYLSLIGVVFFIFVYMTFYNHNFIGVRNLRNLLLNISMLGSIAIGSAIVLIGGEIDLSIGATVSFCGLVLVTFIDKYGALAAILSCLTCGIVIGSVNGLLTVKAKIPSFIATLAMMLIIKTITLISFGTITKYDTNATFQAVRSGTLMGIPYLFLLLLIILVGAWYLLKHLILGRHIYAVGGSEDASRLCGIRVERVKFITFVIMGGLASFTSFLIMANTKAFDSFVGTGLELEAIAAAVVGGATLNGGKGTVFGAILGVVLLETMYTAFNFLGMRSDIQQITKAFILIFALLLSSRKLSKA